MSKHCSNQLQFPKFFEKTLIKPRTILFYLPAGFVVVLVDRGALAVVVPLVLAEVVVFAGEAVRADAVDLTAVVGAAFLSARPGRVVDAPGVGLFWVMGDALAAVGAGLDEGPVRVDPVGPLPAVVLGAVGLDVAVAEPVAGLVGLVAAVDAKKFEKNIV